MKLNLHKLLLIFILGVINLSVDAQTTPATPIDLSITALSDEIINLNWRLSEQQDSTNYIIERALIDSVFTVLDTLKAGNGIIYTDRNAPMVDSLLYRVRGFVENEASDYSNIALLQRCSSNIPTSGTWTAIASGQGLITQNNEVVIEQISPSIYSLSDFSGLFFFNLDQLSPSLGGLVAQVPTILVDMCGTLEMVPTSTGTDTRFGLVQGKGVYDPMNQQITLNQDLGFIESVVFVQNATMPVPNTPAALRASQASDNSIYLEWWDLSSIEDGFVVERAVGQSMNFVEIGSTGTNERTYLDEDASLIMNETYYYRVRARNSSGDSEQSNVESILTRQTNYTILTNSPFQLLDARRRIIIGAWADFNNDGQTDLFATTNPNLNPALNDPSTFNYNDLMLVNGGSNSFSLDEALPFSSNGRSSGITSWTDINNDGLLDLYVSSERDAVTNDGGGGFLYIQESEGQFTTTSLSQGGKVAWGDLNNDGYLDYFSQAPEGSINFNNKDNTFTQSDIEFDPSGFPLIFVDFDNDGLLDIHSNSKIYRNVDGTQFDVVSDSLNGAFFWTDLDQDGNIDLISDNFALFNEGDGTFTQVFIDELTDGTLIGVNDYDNNGFDDLFIRIDLFQSSTGADREIFILDNFGGRNFGVNASSNQFPSSVSNFVTYRPKFADFNNDGFQDFFLATNSFEQNGFLYENNGGSNTYLSIKLDGFASNDLGIGSRIKVETDNGTFYKQFIPSSVNLGGDDLRAHIGLGNATSITMVTVNWPSGQVSEITDLSINQRVTIAEEIVNLPPELEGRTFEIAENSAINTVVGTITASDRNEGDQLRFSIDTGNTEEAFSIDEVSGEITVNNSEVLDFEVFPTFTLTVVVNDGNGASVMATVTINLIDVEPENNAPQVADQTFSILENSAVGTSVGTIVASDVDGDNLSFQITGGNIEETFSLGADNAELQVADNSSLDFDVNPTFVLTVEVNDSNGGISSATITVNIEEEVVLSTDDELVSLLVLYPNPANDVLYLELPNLERTIDKITVSDLSGREYSLAVKMMSRNKMEIVTSELSTGIYLITLKTNEGIATMRWVKE